MWREPCSHWPHLFCRQRNGVILFTLCFSLGSQINHGGETAALNTLLSDQQKPQRPSRLAGENKRSSPTTFILPNPVKEIKVSLLVKRTQTKPFLIMQMESRISSLVETNSLPFPFNSLISPSHYNQLYFLYRLQGSLRS